MTIADSRAEWWNKLDTEGYGPNQHCDSCGKLRPVEAGTRFLCFDCAAGKLKQQAIFDHVQNHAESETVRSTTSIVRVMRHTVMWDDELFTSTNGTRENLVFQIMDYENEKDITKDEIKLKDYERPHSDRQEAFEQLAACLDELSDEIGDQRDKISDILGTVAWENNLVPWCKACGDNEDDMDPDYVLCSDCKAKILANPDA